MSKELQRIDILLVESGKAPTREKARRLIMAGDVLVNNQLVDKPGKKVPSDSIITIKQDERFQFVSRGGLKLQKAIRHFDIDLKGKTAIDVGASTGGFTDCLLQNGADFVYAVDVGYGQLDWKLRNDERVEVIERTNIRYVKPKQFQKEIDIVTIDISFISLDKVLPAVVPLLRSNGDIIVLIKPQFEAGREYVMKGGVVKDPETHVMVIRKVCDTAESLGLTVMGLTYSPVKGPAGNMEYLIWLQKGKSVLVQKDLIEEVVSEAHTASAKESDDNQKKGES